MTDWCYDEESFPNLFSLYAINADTLETKLFEISWVRSDLRDMWTWIHQVADAGGRMVGFNNLGYDYPLLHWIMQNAAHNPGPFEIYRESKRILNTPWNQRFTNQIWEQDHVVPQIDLFTIHHFDNPSRSTSLKELQFNMRSASVQESTVPFDSVLTVGDIKETLDYNKHDTDETLKFYNLSREEIKFREDLGAKWGVNIMNHNSTKIGKDHFIREVERRAPGSCYRWEGKKKVRRNTPRSEIVVGDIIFDYVEFEHPEFKRVLDYLKTMTIYETKGVFKDLSADVGGVDFVFGTGGIHASVEPCTVLSSTEFAIIDIDVKSYYPWLAIANRIYPEHLGETFCDVYKEIYDERVKHPKGSIENAAMKLALNGSFGDTNFEHSALYDPRYAMQITINGQLLICMLAEQLMKNESVELIQANTDGVTVRLPRSQIDWMKSVMVWWEEMTGLMLEDVEYRRMFIRDVNNYIGEFMDGSLKRKGAYEYKNLDWSKDFSALVVPMAAVAALVYGADIREFIETHDDVFDFLLRAKIPKSSKVISEDYYGVRRSEQNLVRYAITMTGYDLYKVMPPTNNQRLVGRTEDRWMRINAGYKVQICNRIEDLNPDDIEYEYYINETLKLVEPLMNKM